jgi:mannose/cellobiose epimerase-like protein (N-acyl-D-glucosamine 2-epimerase family)
MKTLAACCNTTGGRKLAAEWVERAFVSSTEHLVDKNYA